MQHSMISSTFAGSSCLLQRKPLSLRLRSARRHVVRARNTLEESGQAVSSAFAGCQHLHKCRPANRRSRQTKVQAEGPGISPQANAKMPSVWWRAIAALFYLVPWMDILTCGRNYWRLYPQSFWLAYHFEGIHRLYSGSQFTPLIVFFLIYLAIVKNTKLHHFVRFHAMQSVMLDIATMVWSIVKPGLPAEIRYSPILQNTEMYVYSFSMFAILWSVIGALAGRYAEVKFVSDSVYVQVEQSSQMQ